MVKTMKKVIGSFLLAVMLFSTVGDVVALANNSYDTSYDFSFNGQVLYTTYREKTDRSKAYMKCNSITSNRAYTAHVMGRTSPISGVLTDCSNGYTYYFDHAGDYHYMINYVDEWGYNFACIAAAPDSSYSFSASGVWSPDNASGY